MTIFETYESRYVAADGLNTRYLEAGSGPTVVLVHGGGAGADAPGNWTETITALVPHYHVLAPDMVGFGKSEKPEDDGFSYSQAERDRHLAAFIEAMDCAPVTLVGNSMGGLTAMGVALDRPDLVERLVLMGSAGLPVPMSPQLQAIVDYDFTPEGMEKIVSALTGPDFRAPDGMVAYRHALSVDPGAQHAYRRITAWQKANGGLLAGEDRISRLRCPTLVVAGKLDGVVPVTNAYRFLELIEGAWGMIMPRCGHWPMIEFPEVFADIVHRFVERTARA